MGDFGLRNDYLDNRVLELEDTIERLRESLKQKEEKIVGHNFHRLMWKNRLHASEQDQMKMACDVGHNQLHLINFMKLAEYGYDKAKRTLKAWEESDARCVEEILELQESLP